MTDVTLDVAAIMTDCCEACIARAAAAYTPSPMIRNRDDLEAVAEAMCVVSNCQCVCHRRSP